LLFVLAPGVDLWFSGLFFRGGAGFYLRDAVWVGVLYDMVHPLAAVLVLGLLLLLIYNLLRRRAVGPFDVRAVLFMLAVLAIGPGLVVNVVFKDHWGRARPRDVVEFGGTRTFTPAFVISDQCERNCSAAFGGLVGFGRIAQGAHFLSDVVFAGVFVFFVAYLLAHYAFRIGPRTLGTGKG
jgi:lipid A 4'-phosphatase